LLFFEIPQHTTSELTTIFTNLGRKVVHQDRLAAVPRPYDRHLVVDQFIADTQQSRGSSSTLGNFYSTNTKPSSFYVLSVLLTQSVQLQDGYPDPHFHAATMRKVEH